MLGEEEKEKRHTDTHTPHTDTHTDTQELRGGLKIISCMVKYALHCLLAVCRPDISVCVGSTAHAPTHAHNINDGEAYLNEYATHVPAASGKSQSSAHSSQRGESEVGGEARA